MTQRNPHVVSHRERLADQGSTSDISPDLALRNLAESVGPSTLFSSLVRLMPDAAVFAVDGERNVVSWSRGAERLLGYRAEDVLGRYCLTANRCHQCMLGCGISEYGDVADVPMVLLDVDGEQVQVRKTAHAFFDSAGRFIGGVEVLQPDTPERTSAGRSRFHELTTRDPDVQRAFRRVLQLATQSRPALLQGERGVGLSTLCAAVHRELGGTAQALVQLDCAGRIGGHGARPADVAASLLAEGAGGETPVATWVFDAAEHLCAQTVAALLDALSSDARVFFLARTAAMDGWTTAADGLALGIAAVHVPPLRARRVDVEPLVWQVVERRNAEGGRQVVDVAPDVMRRLLDHLWPRNVSELIETVSYAFAVGEGDTLTLAQLPPELQRQSDRATLLTQPPSPRQLNEVELRDKVCEALALSDGHIGRAAELLRVSRPTLWRWRKQLDLT